MLLVCKNGATKDAARRRRETTFVPLGATRSSCRRPFVPASVVYSISFNISPHVSRIQKPLLIQGSVGPFVRTVFSCRDGVIAASRRSHAPAWCDSGFCLGWALYTHGHDVTMPTPTRIGYLHFSLFIGQLFAQQRKRALLPNPYGLIYGRIFLGAHYHPKHTGKIPREKRPCMSCRRSRS